VKAKVKGRKKSVKGGGNVGSGGGGPEDGRRATGIYFKGRMWKKRINVKSRKALRLFIGKKTQLEEKGKKRRDHAFFCVTLRTSGNERLSRAVR